MLQHVLDAFKIFPSKFSQIIIKHLKSSFQIILSHLLKCNSLLSDDVKIFTWHIVE
jgi:hypothetical protein